MFSHLNILVFGFSIIFAQILYDAGHHEVFGAIIRNRYYKNGMNFLHCLIILQFWCYHCLPFIFFTYNS